MHKSLSGVVIVVALVLSAFQASAEEYDLSPDSGMPDVSRKRVNEIAIEAAEPGTSAATGVVAASTGSKPRLPTFTYWSLEWIPGNSTCIRRRITSNPAIARGATAAQRYLALTKAYGAVPVECPRAPQPNRPAAPAEDDVARRFWDVRVLPDPVLKVEPDYAVTGKLVYLQIAGPQTQRFDVANPLGDDVAISASSRYVVEWGDGTTTTTASQGGAWPEGDVTHSYVNTSSGVTVTVTQKWSANWAAGANGGDLSDLRTSSTLTMPVMQIQAVRNS